MQVKIERTKEALPYLPWGAQDVVVGERSEQAEPLEVKVNSLEQARGVQDPEATPLQNLQFVVKAFDGRIRVFPVGSWRSTVETAA